VLLVTLSITGAYLYIRYTKPLYQSASNLKLEIKSTGNNVLGLRGVSMDGGDLYGEIEYIRSEIIYDELLKRSPELHVSYYAKGNILDNELYSSSPFELVYEQFDESLMDQKISVEILSKQEYILSYQIGNSVVKQQYQFGQAINLGGKVCQLVLKNTFSPGSSYSYYYFVVNSRSALINYLQQNLSVGIINQTARIISVAFKEHNIYKARDIVNKIDSIYLEKTVEKQNQSYKQQLRYLDEQIAKIEQKLASYEDTLERFILTNRVRSGEEIFNKALSGIEEMLVKKNTLVEQLTTLQQLDNWVQQDSLNLETLPEIAVDDARLTTLFTELNQLKERRNSMALTRTANSQSLRYLEEQYATAKSKAAQQIQVQQKRLYRQLAEVRGKIAESEQQFFSAPAKEKAFNRIQRLYNIDEGYYLSMLNRKAEIGIAGAGIIPEFVILSPANLPSVAIYPQKRTIYPIGLGVGLILSLLLVGGRYILSDTIGNQAELERLLYAPVLGAVPHYRPRKYKSQHSRLMVADNPRSVLNEALRAIRTNIDFMLPPGQRLHQRAEAKIIAVSSTVSGEGKTFVAVNTAGIIAMSGLRVIVLDCDMRRPKVHLAFDYLDNDNEAGGLSTLLIGRTTLESVIKKQTRVENLHFIPAGPIPPNPSELILRTEFEELLVSLKAKYDIILIDSPPVGLVTDGILIMQKADVPLFVFRANYSRRVFVKGLNKLLQQKNVQNLAAILNASKATGGYGYGYGYGSYGSYQSPYYEEDTPAWRTFLQNIWAIINQRK
jgi:capsular exopolysaccharide synthesis family protein